MKFYKWITTALVGMAILLAGIVCQPVYADDLVLEKDENPVKMIFSEKGGVCLEREGQEKYFNIWNKEDNSFKKLGISKTNVESFDVDGDNLVYIVNNDMYSAVLLYNMSTGQSIKINPSFSHKEGIKVAGNYIAWEDQGLGKNDVVLYNIETAKVTKIQSNYAKNLHLDLSDKYVVYVDNNNDYQNIYIYNIASDEKSMIRQSENNKSDLSLSGNKLVWAEMRERNGSSSGTTSKKKDSYFDELWGNYVGERGYYDIWIYDIGNGKTSKVTDSNVNQIQPVIWENYVAWVEIGMNSPDLKLMELGSGNISTIANSDAYEVQPAMAYGYLSWVSMRGHMADLHVKPLGGGSSEQGGQGDSDNKEIRLVVNGREYHMNPVPYIKDNRTMVPMRRVFEILGADVNWNDAERSVTATRYGTNIKLFIGKKTAYRNGAAVELDAAPEIQAESGRTMVPLRFVSEALGCSVDWDGFSKTVNIQSGM